MNNHKLKMINQMIKSWINENNIILGIITEYKYIIMNAIINLNNTSINNNS